MRSSMADSAAGQSMLERAVRILEAFDARHPGRTVGSIAAHAGIPQASAYRIVNEMVRLGLLNKSPDGTVRPGVGLWELATRGSPVIDLRDAARPFMEDVQSVVRQHTQLAILREREVLVIERLSGEGSVVNQARTAGRLPVHRTSLGLVLLAYSPRHVQARHVRPASARVGSDAPDPIELARLVAEARRRGYAVLRGHLDPDTTGIAVPVLGEGGLAVAALGVVVQTEEEQAVPTVMVLQAAARGIARSLSAPRVVR